MRREPTFFSEWRRRARELRVAVYALYLAYKDPRVPWYAKAFAACVAAYAFSPIDLIPDPIPILGYLDELVLLPLAVLLALKMIPQPVREECLAKAQGVMASRRPTNWIAAAIIVAIWLLLIILAARFVLRAIAR